MRTLVDTHRTSFGVEPICRVLQIAPSSYRRQGPRGVIRGKVIRTTIPDAKGACPLDRVNRQFKAERPDQLRVSDFTYVSTWQGWWYVAFVIDVYARRIVGWRVSSSMHTDCVLDALEQARYARQPERDGTLIHHSDRSSQGGFSRSLQHLHRRCWNNSADRASGDALAGPTGRQSAGDQTSVLEAHRRGAGE